MKNKSRHVDGKLDNDDDSINEKHQSDTGEKGIIVTWRFCKENRD